MRAIVARMAALIQFTQGSLTDLAGRALKGTVGPSVTVSNSAGVSGTYTLLEVPVGSALTVGSTQVGTTATFSPDANGGGTYQWGFSVAGVLQDTRDFITPDVIGRYFPGFRSTALTYNPGGSKIGWKADLLNCLTAPLPVTAAQTVGATTVQLTSLPMTASTNMDCTFCLEGYDTVSGDAWRQEAECYVQQGANLLLNPVMLRDLTFVGRTILQTGTLASLTPATAFTRVLSPAAVAFKATGVAGRTINWKLYFSFLPAY
jgi:hypothetical protein